ncbi:MAG: YtxH domain-containing protein [Tannerella sp.]|nr:YtxH domain-containing protein [Tannerella sp.]
MKSNVDSKLLLGLVIGGAIGATIGYLAATDKKEQILNDLNDLLAKAKNAFTSAVSTYREGKADTAIAGSEEPNEA